MATAESRKSERRLLLLVIAGGLLLRAIWLVRVHGGIDLFLEAAEATRAALSVARHGVLGDAYFIGQGPSAHLGPVSPMIAGAILWMLGPGSTAANMTLLGWSLGQVGAGYLVCRLIYAELGSEPAALRWGAALAFLITPFVPQEVIDFRYWEGALAALLAALNLTLVLRLDRTREISVAGMAIAAVLAAVTFLTSPPVGLAVGICWAVTALRCLSIARSLSFAGIALVALIMVLTPWAIRNQQAVGMPLITRSNSGLELAIANHPDALSNRAPEHVFANRIAAIHPSSSSAARAIVATPGGEVHYSTMLGKRTRLWITAHPGKFARLWLRHLRQFFFPEPWQFYFTGWEGMRGARSLTVSLISLFGLSGIASGLMRRRRGYGILALYIAALALPYAAFQPMPRYTFLIWGLLVFPAAEAALALICAVGGIPRRRQTAAA